MSFLLHFKAFENKCVRYTGRWKLVPHTLFSLNMLLYCIIIQELVFPFYFGWYFLSNLKYRYPLCNNLKSYMSEPISIFQDPGHWSERYWIKNLIKSMQECSFYLKLLKKLNINCFSNVSKFFSYPLIKHWNVYHIFFLKLSQHAIFFF